MASTQDWAVHHVVFDSLDHSEANLYLGCWGGTTGELWYDDASLEEVTFGKRRVLLCRAHAGIAHNSGVKTFEELRELYTEQHGSRSFVPRRARSLTGVVSKKKSRSVGRRIGDSA